MAQSTTKVFSSSKLFPGSGSLQRVVSRKHLRRLIQQQLGKVSASPIAYARPEVGQSRSAGEDVEGRGSLQRGQQTGRPSQAAFSSRRARSFYPQRVDDAPSRHVFYSGLPRQSRRLQNPTNQGQPRGRSWPLTSDPTPPPVPARNLTRAQSDTLSPLQESPRQSTSNAGTNRMTRSRPGGLRIKQGKRNADLDRRKLDWLVWEQRERKEEAVRRKRKQEEILRRQQEALERRAAKEVSLRSSGILGCVHPASLAGPCPVHCVRSARFLSLPY
jgi:hypothetical protein